MKKMPARLLPLFPLDVVVFPRVQLPLHIFEERYKLMVGRAIDEQSEFGIVLARGESIVNAGCTVMVDQVLKRYEDGRMDILTSGRRRFEVLSLNDEETYLQGEVEFFEDEEEDDPASDLKQRVMSQYRGLVEAGALHPVAQAEMTDPQLSFQLAHGIQDLDFLNLLLRNRSESGRLKELNEYFSQYIPRQRYIERMKELQPRNGSGHKPADL